MLPPLRLIHQNKEDPLDLTELFHKRQNEIKELVIDPKILVKKLGEYVIGQDSAKRALALAVFNRSVRMLHGHGVVKLDVPIKKHNVLLAGNTGSGKTALVRALGEIVDVCITFSDFSGITARGYHGKGLVEVVENHIDNASTYAQEKYAHHCPEYIVEQIDLAAATGVLYIDEFDKCRSRDPSLNTSGKDFTGSLVQAELLGLLEGDSYSLTKANAFFDPSHLLIICSGAFVGLDEIILRRLNKKSTMGFGGSLKATEENNSKILDHLTPEDLVEYGFLPELVGRIPLISSLRPLTDQDLLKILTDVKGSLISEQKSLFKLFGIDLQFTNTALLAIAKQAKLHKTGARALRALVGRVTEELQYSIYDSETTIRVTEKMVNNALEV